MDNKIYTPSTITDQPFPQAILEQSNNMVIVPTATNQIYAPSVIQDTGLPMPHIATETISDTLNTQTRKIIKEYQFTPSGALQIGDFTQGVSGDLRISPDGIAARNIAGETTFSIDGDTGDAAFQGDILAKDFTIADDQGLVSLSNFTHTETSLQNINQTITSTSPVDITNSTLTFTTQRQAVILISGQIFVALQEDAGAGNTCAGIGYFVIDGAFHTSFIAGSGIDGLYSQTFSRTFVLNPGQHTLKLQGFISSVVGTPSLLVVAFVYNYIILGS